MSDAPEGGDPGRSGMPQEQATPKVIIDPTHPHAGKGGVVPPEHSRMKPGQTLNPGGRPKGASILGPLLREFARHPDEDGYGEKAVEAAKRLAAAALAGDREAVDAILKVMDRTDGPVEKKVEHSGEVTQKRIVLEQKGPDAAS